MSAADRLARAREQLAEQAVLEATQRAYDAEHSPEAIAAAFITPRRARMLRGVIEANRAEAEHDAELAEALLTAPAAAAAPTPPAGPSSAGTYDPDTAYWHSSNTEAYYRNLRRRLGRR